ncbi:serine/Threonine protein kinase and Signal Transduction Histidine Kinase [Gracilibacillus boraciitolerans JCM 21714]|uniref:Serine/Threonine protein kinase and Signal Transduction Histidine Kinase n=1 Tax=Gracilibacillus boraciitolerans JCM 21714 TaxID=1298598 RepID=W4VMI5_9BACI|nr:serine/Threonine protein kinase and Signal Transduction Histidine Kinase [Gracilibacillus boraciitolerans JCM 21714]
MRKLSDYQFHEQIGMSYSWLLYKAVSILNQEQVLIKTSRNQASPHAKAELIHEYYLLKELDLTGGVLKPVALKKGKEIPYLVMEFFDGIPLSDWMKGNPAFDVNRYLKMALQLTSILSAVHQHHIIHKSLHLDNILYDNDTNQLKLTGFHQSTTLSKETPQADITPYQIGEVISVSPEQTGRMNRAIDYRTDLYSLGVLFYQLATGRAPFEGKGQAEIIHAHLAQTAVSPDQINPALPTIVSSIIMKLLAKDPENRYQSTYGLKKDLEKCFALFHSEQEVDVFPLAEHDVSPMLEKPNKLYGRGGSELALLMESFERVQHGRPGLVLIPGSAGIGKTALVQHLHTPLLHKKGYFISGKFVQFQKHTPYAPIIELFAP